MKIKSILISQPKPETEKSPYFDIAKKYGVRIDFRPFVQVVGIPLKDFRKTKIEVQEYPSIILNSKNSVDHYFRICEELKLPIKDSLKYFCFSESIAFYLQKYVTYRKRKIFYGKGCIDDLAHNMQKFSEDKFLVPLSDNHKQDIPDKLTSLGLKYSVAVLYKTIPANFADMSVLDYDLIIFFSPAGVQSLFHNYPNFVQDKTCIGAFGPSTAKEVEKSKLRLDFQAPIPGFPSMTASLEEFLRINNK